MNPFVKLDWDLLAKEELPTGNMSGWYKDPEAYFETLFEKGEADRKEFFLQQALQCVAPTPGMKILDIGSGLGELASLMRDRGAMVTCLEPNPLCHKHLVNKGFEVLSENWLDYQALRQWDLVLSCRSLGVSALKDGQIYLQRSLNQMIHHASSEVLIILRGFSENPYLFHLGILLAEGYKPSLTWMEADAEKTLLAPVVRLKCR